MLHKGGSARLGDRAEIVDEVVAGHTDTGVFDGDRVSVLVVRDANLEVLGFTENFRLREREEANLVEGVGAVADELAKKDLSRCVETVNDNVHEARDFGLELKLFRRSGGLAGSVVLLRESSRRSERRAGHRCEEQRVSKELHACCSERQIMYAAIMKTQRDVNFTIMQ